MYSNVRYTSVYTSLAYCVSYISILDDKRYTSYGCSDVNTALTIVANPPALTRYSLSTDQFGFTHSYPLSSTSSGTDTPTPTPTSAVAANTQTFTAEEVIKEQPKIVGAIVGSVIGGIVLVGACTLAAVYSWIRVFPDKSSSSITSEAQPAVAEGATAEAAAAEAAAAEASVAKPAATTTEGTGAPMSETPVAAPQPVHPTNTSRASEP